MKSPNRRAAFAAAAMIAALPMLAFQGGPSGTRRLDYLTGYLSLTETQRTQALAIFTAAATASETLRGSLDTARTAVKTAIKANVTDAELDRLSATVGTLEGQLTAVHAKAEAKFYALLTTDQKAKYDEMRGPGGPGGRQPGGPR